jgi:hypothetical protein
MRPMAAAPAATTAVVVGIGHYPGRVVSDESAPAYDAAAFATQLVRQGVPREQIIVLITPSGTTSAAPELRDYPPADRTTVQDVFTRTLPELTGDALIVFWAGHGYELRSGQRLFVPSGSTVTAVSVNELTGWLRSGQISFPRQQIYVDACRQSWDDHDTILPQLTFPDGAPRADVSQEFLGAAAIGTRSTVLTAKHSTRFSTALRAEIAALSADEWLPDIGRLAAGVRSRDKRLNSVSVTWLDHAGNGEVTRFGPRVGQAMALAECLRQVPEMGTKRQLAKLMDTLNEVSGYPLPAPSSPTAAQLARLLVELDNGGDLLDKVIRLRSDLFPVHHAAVSRLRMVVDQLAGPGDGGAISRG